MGSVLSFLGGSNMNVTVGSHTENAEAFDVELYLLAADEEGPQALDYELTSAMKAFGQITLFYGRKGLGHMAAAGLGEMALLDAERLRRAAGQAARAIRDAGFRSVAVNLDAVAERWERGGKRSEEAAAAWTEGWLLGSYVFDRYVSRPRETAVERLHIAGLPGGEAGSSAVKQAELRAEATMLARDWSNEPANVLHPESLVARVTERFAGSAVTTRVYQGEELAREGMEGLLAVGGGGRYAPAMIELRYAGDSDQPLLALIGKGITFDMGGMNVKTGRDLSEARFDLGGACAVIGAMELLSRLGAKANVAAYIPVADNMPDGAAMLPSAIIRYPNGMTVQVGNTDAEGRLVLADALLLAQRHGAAEALDIATLTGSVGHALGLNVAGVWGDEERCALLRRLGERSGDRVWPMPLVEEDDNLLRSEYADVSNISSSPYGGAIAAALFLRRFVSPGLRWTHVDMANTVQQASASGYRPAGATGFGVRLLADYVLTVSGEGGAI